MNPRIYTTPADYRHIQVYGILAGWSKDMVKGQQHLAYMLNAPYDTVELIGEEPRRFRDLPREDKQLFGSV